MLIVELRINRRPIKAIGVHNVHPNVSAEFQGECPYNIYVSNASGKFDIENPLGQIRHERWEGAEALAAKALDFVAKNEK